MIDTDYTPKHMKDKEATLANWQNQARQAAARMEYESRHWTGMDGQVWAFLSSMAESRELNEVLYDYGHLEDEGYKPKHLVVEETSKSSLPARRCSCGNLIGAYGNGRCKPTACLTNPRRRCVSCGDDIGYNIYGNGSCGPSGCLNRPA